MKAARIVNFIRDMNMLQKLTIGFLIIFITPVCLIGYISYKNYENSIKKLTTDYVTQISEEMINNLDAQVTNMENTTLIPYYMNDMQDVLQIPGFNPDKSKLMLKYISLLNAKGGDNNYVYVLDNYGNVFSNSGNNERFNIKNCFNEYKQKAYTTNGKSIVLGTQRVTDSVGRTRYYLTVIRDIKELNYFQKIGLTVIDGDISIIENSVKKLEFLTGGKVIIMDSGNNVIYDTSKSLIAKVFSDNELLANLNTGITRFKSSKENESYICISSSLSRLDWKLFVIISESYIMKDALKTSRLIIWISGIAGILAFGFFTLLSYKIVKPLRKLILLMDKVQNGNLDVHFNVKSHDEVGRVCFSFNNMVGELKRLINEIYITNIKKKQIEIETLQKQINPHFIYNTLETVRMLSVLHKTEDINDVVHVFGELLRYSINYINDVVTIKDELKHLEDYVYIQNKCFIKGITLETMIEESLKDMKTIKLIFQPIIENSFIHGFKNRKEGGRIIITSEQKEGFVIFKISDNGIGIKTEELNELNRILEMNSNDPIPIKSIGIRNVNERMKLNFGNGYGVIVNSQPGIGTEVELKFPGISVEGARDYA